MKRKMIWNLVESEPEPCEALGGVLICSNKVYVVPVVENLENWK